MEPLKSDFSEATEASKVKRIFRFLTNNKINPVVKAGLTTGFIGSLNYEYLCFEGTHP